MKKFTKIALIIAAIMAGITLFCVIGAVALGFTWDKLGNMMEDDKFNFNGNSKVGNAYEEIQATCNELEIELGAGTLELVYGDVQKIRVEEENVSNYKCYVDENTLHIEGNRSASMGKREGTLRVTIPNNMVLEEFDLEVGAGQVNVKNLNARKINVETGAGELFLEVVGKKEDYSYNLECGIGELKVGEDSYSGLGNENKIKNPDAQRFIDAECGVGKIHINFTE